MDTFEGPEKKLVIQFHSSTRNLREVSREKWSEILEHAKCSILNVIQDEKVTAYLLSESSMYVYDHRVMLKTCGTTVPLLAIPALFDLVMGPQWAAKQVESFVEFCVYTRTNYLFPKEQIFPHQTFEQEVVYLEQFFSGDACLLGSKKNSSMHLFCASFNPDGEEVLPLVKAADDMAMTEIICMGLNPQIADLFSIEKQDEGRVVLQSIWDSFGVDHQIDEFFFEPYGYSCNIISGGKYITMHLTPQASCSFVSVETTLPMESEALKTFFQAMKVFGATDMRLMRFQSAGVFDKFQPSCIGKSTQFATFEGEGFSCAYQQFLKEPITRVVPEPRLMEEETANMETLLDKIQQRLNIPSVPGNSKCDKIDSLRAVGEIALKTLQQPDTPVMMVDMQTIVDMHTLWEEHLPKVKPYYAVKCNSDPVLLQTLAALGTGFDCASAAEMTTVSRLGVHPSRIVYANPCKQVSNLEKARDLGVKMVVFDNLDELDKMHAQYREAELLLRIAVEDSSAQCPMSMKFGARLSECLVLLKRARELGLNVIGVSFHVGSGCTEPLAFDKALMDTRKVFDMAYDIGFEMRLVDIGGGFPGGGSFFENSFAPMAARIRRALDDLFPTTEIIAEPGRFFACASHSLLTQVFSKATVDNSCRYYMNDGVYGSFNCIFYDHAVVEPHLLQKKEGAAVPGALFGPTCDGLDQIASDLQFPELEVGDWLLWENMGAYTVAASSSFNGIAKPVTFYYRSC